MKKPLENNYLKVFRNNLWSNVQSGLANLGKAIIGRILYVSHFCLRHRDKIITSECALVAVIAFFVIFSSLEMKNLYENANHDNLISKIANQDKIIIKAQNASNKQSSSDNKETSDFHIAGNRMLADSDIHLTLGGSTLITPETEFNDSMPNTRTEVEKYVVEAGDNIYTIAQKFGINITSILAANNLTLRSANLIRPGQMLSILPIDGLTHKVKSGETLDQIAKKYKASINDIVDFNGLADASDILANDILIIPYGSQPSAPPVIIKPQVVQPRFEKTELVITSPNYNSWLKNTKCHKFYNGQCTSYVAYKWATDLGKCISWSGNAKNWLGNARQQGFKIGDEPQKGAVVSLCEAGRGCCGRSSYCWGHVAYVESFNNDTITFTEMNHPTPWRVTQRTIDRDDVRILGYIYAE